ncbi:MAG: acyl-CoA dehydrogenase, partial [Novosphingobium sp.]
RWMMGGASLDDKLAGSVPFCTMAAVAVAGWQLQRQARDGAGGEAKRVVAHYFAAHIAAEARGLKASAVAGAGLIYALDAEALAG